MPSSDPSNHEDDAEPSNTLRRRSSKCSSAFPPRPPETPDAETQRHGETWMPSSDPSNHEDDAEPSNTLPHRSVKAVPPRFLRALSVSALNSFPHSNLS